MDIPEELRILTWKGETYYAHPSPDTAGCAGCVFSDDVRRLLLNEDCVPHMCTGLLPGSDEPYSIIFSLEKPDGDT